MPENPMPRRNLLKLVGAVPAAVLLASCDGNSMNSSATSSPTVPVASGSGASWASGDADLITADFPKTSIFSSANTCRVSLTGSATEGPCYFQVNTGEDITQGRTGLPMQLCAQLTDEQCAPLEGYTVEVWQCDARGKYSGNTASSGDASRFNQRFCTENDSEALTSNYLRGQRTTDAEGRVNFKSIFPGWYAGRVIHIHFAVTDPAGKRRLVSQWVYPESLCTEICTDHELYSARGKQDTPLVKDGLVPADGGNQMLATKRNNDGTLLAYGVIQISG